MFSSFFFRYVATLTLFVFTSFSLKLYTTLPDLIPVVMVYGSSG